MSEEENTSEETPTEATEETTASPEATPEPAPETEPKPAAETAPTSTSNAECPSSPTGAHDMFHNEGTDETYCRYCGKT